MLSCPECTANNLPTAIHCCACTSELNWDLLIKLKIQPNPPKELRVTLSPSSTIAHMKEHIKQQYPEAIHQIVVINGNPTKDVETLSALKLSHESTVNVTVPQKVVPLQASPQMASPPAGAAPQTQTVVRSPISPVDKTPSTAPAVVFHAVSQPAPVAKTNILRRLLPFAYPAPQSPSNPESAPKPTQNTTPREHKHEDSEPEQAEGPLVPSVSIVSKVLVSGTGIDSMTPEAISKLIFDITRVSCKVVSVNAGVATCEVSKDQVKALGKSFVFGGNKYKIATKPPKFAVNVYEVGSPQKLNATQEKVKQMLGQVAVAGILMKPQFAEVKLTSQEDVNKVLATPLIKWEGVEFEVKLPRKDPKPPKPVPVPVPVPAPVPAPTREIAQPVPIKSAPILEYLKRLVLPQLVDVRCHSVSAKESSVIRVSGFKQTSINAAVGRLNQTAEKVQTTSVVLPRPLVLLLRSTEEFKTLEAKQVVCFYEGVESEEPSVKADSDAMSVFSDLSTREDQKEESSSVMLSICAIDGKLIEEVAKRMETLKSTFVCKQIPLQHKQLACLKGRPPRSAENGVVLTDVPQGLSRGELAATLARILKVPISESMLHYNNRKQTVTVSHLAPATRSFLLSKRTVIFYGKALQVQQPKVKQEVKPINRHALEKKNRTCLWVNRDDLTLSIYGYNSQSVEATQAALARLITPATSILKVDQPQADFLQQHKAKILALQDLHGVAKLEYQSRPEPCYYIEGAFCNAVAAARDGLEQLATLFVSTPFAVRGIPRWLVLKTVVAWIKAHDEFGSCWNDDQTEVKLVSQDEDGLVTAQQEMTTILKNIQDSSKKISLSPQECRSVMDKVARENFQQSWDVQVRADSTNTVSLLGDSPDTTEAAWDALNGFLKNTQMSSSSVSLPSDTALGLFVRKSKPAPPHPLNILSAFKKIVITQNKRVHVSEVYATEEDKKAGDPQEMKWMFKGSAGAVQEALEEAKAKLVALSRDVGQTTVALDARKAEGLLKGIGRIKKVMLKTSTFIELEGGAGNVLLALQTAKGHKIQIVRGDIASVTADAIVNAANSQLSHGSGVALALAQAAGPTMVAACGLTIATDGSVPPGTSRATIPGKLACKVLIHTVGPIWGGGETGESGTLASAVTSALNLANAQGCCSVALPALSCGVFAFPENQGAEIILGAIRMWCESNDTKLKAIDVVIKDQKTCRAFVAVADHVAGVLDAKQSEEEDAVLKALMLTPQTASEWQWYRSVSPGEPEYNSADPWVPYDFDQNQVLERDYQTALKRGSHVSSDIPGDALGKKNGFSYTVQFDLTGDNHQQTNTTTKRSRPVKRLRSVAPAPLTPVAPTGGKLTRLTATTTGTKNFKILGLATHLVEAAKLLREASESVLGEKSLVLKEAIPQATIRGIQAIAAQNEFHVKFDTSADKTTIILQGFVDNMDAVLAKVQQHLLDNRLTDKPRFEFPKEWVSQSGNLHLADVDPASDEFKQIETRMLSGENGGGVPNTRVERIQRIQNIGLWNSYSLQQEILKKKLTKDFRELPLFHGTRKADPRLIYNGEIGFAMQYCDSGMWGRGTYFAANFSYSNGYRSTTADGKSQVFLATVLVGASHDCPSDPSLKMPPVKPEGSGLFEGERYDSVTGTTGGSRVYIIYENSRAYPSYLITYTQK